MHFRGLHHIISNLQWLDISLLRSESKTSKTKSCSFSLPRYLSCWQGISCIPFIFSATFGSSFSHWQRSIFSQDFGLNEHVLGHVAFGWEEAFLPFHFGGLSYFDLSHFWSFYLRVNVSKDQSRYKQGPSIWLIPTYIVQFFTLILVVLSVFHENDRMEDYGRLKFWQIRPREKIHNFLICGPNRTGFLALDSSWKTLQIM